MSKQAASLSDAAQAADLQIFEISNHAPASFVVSKLECDRSKGDEIIVSIHLTKAGGRRIKPELLPTAADELLKLSNKQNALGIFFAHRSKVLGLGISGNFQLKCQPELSGGSTKKKLVFTFEKKH